MSKAVDLSRLAVNADQPTEMELLHPVTKKGLGIYFQLLGADAKELRELEREQFDRQMARARRGKAGDYDDLQEGRMALLLRVTRGWRSNDADGSVIVFDGVPILFTPDEARKLYSDVRFTWIKDQVIAFVSNRENFFASLPTT